MKKNVFIHLNVLNFFSDNGENIVHTYDENDYIQNSRTLELEVEVVPVVAVLTTERASEPGIDVEKELDTTIESQIVEPVEVQLARPDTVAFSNSLFDKQKENQQPNASVTSSEEVQRLVFSYLMSHLLSILNVSFRFLIHIDHAQQ